MNARTFNKSYFIYLFIFLIVVVLLVAAGVFYYDYESGSIHSSNYDNLKAISDLKVSQISSWIRERFNDAKILADDPFISGSLNELESTPGNGLLEGNILKNLNSLKLINNYGDIFIIDKNYNMEFSTASVKIAMDDKVKSLIGKSFITGKSYLSDFYRSARNGKIYLDFLTPVAYGSRILAVLLLRVDPDTYLYPLIQSWPVVSGSGESLLVRKDDGYVVFLNDLKFMKNAALNFKISIKDRSLPAARAVQGLTGPFEGRDYRNVRVHSYLAGIPGTSWYLITKVDSDEILSGLYYRIIVIIIMELLSIMLVGAVLIYMFNSRQKKIYQDLYRSEFERKALAGHIEHITRYANDIIILADENFRIMEANEKALSTYNYSRDEMLAMRIPDLRAPDTRLAYRDDVRNVIEKDGSIYETTHRRRDGTVFPVEVSERLIEIEGLKYHHQIIRDITERVKAVERIRESENKYRSLFENMMNGIAVCKVIFDENDRAVDFVYLDVNNSFSRITGLEDVLGRNATDLIPGIRETNPELFEIYGRCALTGSPEKFESYVEPLKIWFNISVFCPEKGYFIAVFENITERKNSEEIIRKNLREKEELLHNIEIKNKELEGIIHATSHDLRSPLINLMGFSELLENACSDLVTILDKYCESDLGIEPAMVILNDKIPKALDFIKRSYTKMDNLIKGLLTVSRTGRLPLNFEFLNMKAMMIDIVKTLEFQIQRAGASVNIGDLPECYGDYSQLSRLFFNLIDNAIKYRDPGRELIIRISGYMEKNNSVYVVSDTGRGIAKEYQDKIWEIFTRIDADKNTEGEGIGLTLALNIVQRHFGFIRVESKPGKGTSFFITIPGKRN